MVDPTRHIDIFDPSVIEDKKVSVIGAGATGSKIVLELAKLGVENIEVFDFDTVESHNIANQAYANEHKGMLKVDALAEIVKMHTGTEILKRPERYETGPLGEFIFLLVDTMKARQDIARAMELNFNKELIIETRMGINLLSMYTIDATNEALYNKWVDTFCSDDEAPESSCGSKISVGPTSTLVSGFAVWNFMRYVQQKYMAPELINNGVENDKTNVELEDIIENEFILATQPLEIMKKKWD